jgi:hypothetical protein
MENHQGRATTGYAIASVAISKEFQKNYLFSEYAFQVNHMATSPAYPLCKPWEDKKYSYDWFNSIEVLENLSTENSPAFYGAKNSFLDFKVRDKENTIFKLKFSAII